MRSSPGRTSCPCWWSTRACPRRCTTLSSGLSSDPAQTPEKRKDGRTDLREERLREGGGRTASIQGLGWKVGRMPDEKLQGWTADERESGGRVQECVHGDGRLGHGSMMDPHAFLPSWWTKPAAFLPLWLHDGSMGTPCPYRLARFPRPDAEGSRLELELDTIPGLRRRCDVDLRGSSLI